MRDEWDEAAGADFYAQDAPGCHGLPGAPGMHSSFTSSPSRMPQKGRLYYPEWLESPVAVRGD